NLSDITIWETRRRSPEQQPLWSPRSLRAGWVETAGGRHGVAGCVEHCTQIGESVDHPPRFREGRHEGPS
ncbi:MAG: hypothetical protein PVG25_11660, partial [Anaerolineae bacterium]